MDCLLLFTRKAFRKQSKNWCVLRKGAGCNRFLNFNFFQKLARGLLYCLRFTFVIFPLEWSNNTKLKFSFPAATPAVFSTETTTIKPWQESPGILFSSAWPIVDSLSWPWPSLALEAQAIFLLLFGFHLGMRVNSTVLSKSSLGKMALTRKPLLSSSQHG